MGEALVGIEPLSYQVFELEVAGSSTALGKQGAKETTSDTIHTSSASDMPNDTSVASNTSWSHTVSHLETGVRFYVRVSARGQGVGYGGAAEASNNPVTPRGVPGQIPILRLSPADATTLQVELEQTAETNGAQVVRYDLEWDTSPLFTSKNIRREVLAPDYGIQAVRLDSWQRGWTPSSSFSLSLFDFHGSFTARLGGVDADGLHTFVSISEGTNLLSRMAPNATAGFGSASLCKAVPRGGFVRVGGQNFRVCLDGDTLYGEDALTLCSIEDAYVPELFEGGKTKYDDTLTRISAHVLDTAMGSGFKLATGDTTLRTYNGPDTNLTVNDLTSVLARGDLIRLGHPENGRVFTVCAAGGPDASLEFNLTSVPLCSGDDPEERVSVLEKDIMSATREIQTFGFWINKSSETWLAEANVTGMPGFRIKFGEETSSRSTSGGGDGCLPLHSTGAEVSIPDPQGVIAAVGRRSFKVALIYCGIQLLMYFLPLTQWYNARYFVDDG